MIPYSSFVKKIQSITLEAHDPRLPHFLGEVTSEESAAGRGMLTALVVHKVGDLQPGPGFFELARQLGHQFTDIEKFWIQEVKRVFEVWAKK
jgi:molybdopterin synthase catalytic subunit